MYDPFVPLTEEEHEEFVMLKLKENPTKLESKRMIELLVQFRMSSIYDNIVDLLHPRPDQKVVRDFLRK